MHQHNSQSSGFEFTARYDIHIVPLTDVVDVDGNAGVRPDTVLFH